MGCQEILHDVLICYLLPPCFYCLQSIASACQSAIIVSYKYGVI